VIFDNILSDEGNTVATSYDVMQWQAATGEPGHTFVLVDEAGEIAWVKDYGASEQGGVMWVGPDELLGRAGTAPLRGMARELECHIAQGALPSTA
jgi:hypothetical protein